MTYMMGIDGGGSTVRVVITTPDLSVRGESEGPGANPGVVGAETARAAIQTTMRTALDHAGLAAGDIAAVGIGIAGAAARHSADWLREVVAPVLPQARIVPSADYEIALIGAMGERRGVLILAGTGSFAYGVNAAGESALVGGWGYLLGDEGSGYWIGLEGLRAVIQASDGSGPATTLTRVLLDALNLPDAPALLPWLYRAGVPRTREIAALAPLVIEQAQDMVAEQIMRHAARKLATCAQTVSARLQMGSPSYAFAGGVITTLNAVSRMLCTELGLVALPVPRYSPVIGAALRALMEEKTC